MVFKGYFFLDIWPDSEYISGMHILRKKWNATKLHSCAHLSGWAIYHKELVSDFEIIATWKRENLRFVGKFFHNVQEMI